MLIMVQRLTRFLQRRLARKIVQQAKTDLGPDATTDEVYFWARQIVLARLAAGEQNDVTSFVYDELFPLGPEWER